MQNHSRAGDNTRLVRTGPRCAVRLFFVTAAPAHPSLPPTMASAQTSRTPFLDMAKGLACAVIVAHHLAFYGPMSDIAQPLAPGLMAWLYDYGRMAVQVFLVLAGYLAAVSLAPQGVARYDSALQQALRRYARLVTPYLVALLVTLAVAALVRPWFEHASVPSEPSGLQLLAHGLLLHGVLGHESLSAGVWYVAIDFQLFCVALLVWSGARALGRRMGGAAGARTAQHGAQALVVLGAAASLWGFNRDAGWDNWACYFFGAYALGILAYWAVQAQQPGGWLAVLLALLGVALWIDYRTRIAVAGGTALLLVLAMRWPRLRGLGWGPLVQLGQRAYSVFLIHFAVCLLVNAIASRWWPAVPVLHAGGMVLAWGLSVAAGWLLYDSVERHSIDLRATARWFAGLLLAGSLLEWYTLAAA